MARVQLQSSATRRSVRLWQLRAAEVRLASKYHSGIQSVASALHVHAGCKAWQQSVIQQQQQQQCLGDPD